VNDKLQKEHDPSKLLADTPCKLLRFLVTDGSHVVADTPYAEVEVMKMCMPLLLPASGVIHFVMPEGQAMKVPFFSTPLLACLQCYMYILVIGLYLCL
jgi:biotin carboxyl carrier protein